MVETPIISVQQLISNCLFTGALGRLSAALMMCWTIALDDDEDMPLDLATAVQHSRQGLALYHFLARPPHSNTSCRSARGT